MRLLEQLNKAIIYVKDLIHNQSLLFFFAIKGILCFEVEAIGIFRKKTILLVLIYLKEGNFRYRQASENTNLLCEQTKMMVFLFGSINFKIF